MSMQQIVTEMENLVSKQKGKAHTYKLSELDEQAPLLAKAIRQSAKNIRQDAPFLPNDSVVNLASFVIIEPNSANFGIYPHKGADAPTKYDLYIDPTYTIQLAKVGLTNDEFVSMLEHEHGHAKLSQHANKEVAKTAFSDSIDFQTIRATELYADRFVSSEVDSIGYFLRESKVNPFSYDTDSKNYEHPNNRERMTALLKEAYFNEIIGNAGTFSGKGKDYEFHPNTDSKTGLPVAQNGQVIQHWDETEKIVNARVNLDIRMVDAAVKEGLQDIDGLKGYLKSRVESFKKSHDVYAQNAPESSESKHSSALASSFLTNSVSKESVAKNIEQEPKMANAYLALHLVEQNVTKAGLSENQQQAAVSQAKFTIAEGIQQGSFPDVSRLEVADSKYGNLISSNTAHQV